MGPSKVVTHWGVEEMQVVQIGAGGWLCRRSSQWVASARMVRGRCSSGGAACSVGRNRGGKHPCGEGAVVMTAIGCIWQIDQISKYVKDNGS